MACARATPPSESLWACACSGAGIFLWQSALPPFALPNSGTLPLLHVQTFSLVLLPCHSHPQLVVYCSPTHGTVILSPLGCLHTANPIPLPGTDLQSLSLSTVMSGLVVQMICSALTLLYFPQRC